MDWVKWLIPLIALVVWILANLLRVPDQPKQQRRNPRPVPPRDDDPFLKDENPMTDLDRFILEAKKRREQEEHRKSQQRSQPPVMQPRPAPSAQRPQPSRTSERQTSRGTPPPLPAKIPSARTPGTQQRTRAPQRTPSYQLDPEHEKIILALEAKAEQQDRRAAEKEAYARLQQERSEQLLKASQPSRAARSIVQMLSNPESARVAIALREILDKPLARRRR